MFQARRRVSASGGGYFGDPRPRRVGFASRDGYGSEGEGVVLLTAAGDTGSSEYTAEGGGTGFRHSHRKGEGRGRNDSCRFDRLGGGKRTGALRPRIAIPPAVIRGGIGGTHQRRSMAAMSDSHSRNVRLRTHSGRYGVSRSRTGIRSRRAVAPDGAGGGSAGIVRRAHVQSGVRSDAHSSPVARMGGYGGIFSPAGVAERERTRGGSSVRIPESRIVGVHRRR
mmetsp:Transcript_12205/g.35750  ORF Transcript_12205/g.35750 Transcript_12205/m.35750 type:complete len:224 (-) Transcript_12205:286-957(-)